MRESGLKYLWAALALGMMVFLFIQSNISISQESMVPYLKRNLSIAPGTLPDVHFTYAGRQVTTHKPYEFLNFMIRKAVHVIQYLILTLVLLKTAFLFSRARTLPYFIGCGLAFLFACTDEWHQSFIPRRSGLLMDVLIPDLLGILLAALVYVWYRKKIHIIR